MSVKEHCSLSDAPHLWCFAFCFSLWFLSRRGLCFLILRLFGLLILCSVVFLLLLIRTANLPTSTSTGGHGRLRGDASVSCPVRMLAGWVTSNKNMLSQLNKYLEIFMYNEIQDLLKHVKEYKTWGLYSELKICVYHDDNKWPCTSPWGKPLVGVMGLYLELSLFHSSSSSSFDESTSLASISCS